MKHLLPKTLTDLVLVGVLIGIPGFSLLVHTLLPASDRTAGGGVALTATSTANPFDSVHLEAKAAVVYDIKNNKILFAKNAENTFPLASITKIMTGLVAAESFPQDIELTFESDYLNEEGDSGLLPGEKWSLKKLIAFTLVASSNDGARALAAAIQAIQPEQSFQTLMNSKAAKLGLATMRFNNPTGLDVGPTEAGGYGSALDVAKLFGYTLKHFPEVLEPTKENMLVVASNISSHTANNTDIIVNEIPGLIGSKTGYSDLAGGNLAIVIDAGINRPIAIVALGSSYDGRFSDVLKLSRTTYEYLALKK